jgi:sugar phosphate isomerase/epimerase
MRMSLGIIGRTNEESLKLAASKGLDFVEFCINENGNLDEFLSNVKNILSWKEQYGLKVGSIGSWGPHRINKEGRLIEEELNNNYRLIDAASELECVNFVTGCNYVEELSYYENSTAAIDYFSKLMDYGKSKGVAISSYNCGWNNFVDNDMAWTVIHGYLQALGIKYDPSHSRYAGRDYLKETKDWAHRFKHIHIKGSLIVDGKAIDDPPAGLDQTDWGTFMAILYAKKYNGGLSIEPHSNTWTGELGENGIDFTISVMRKYLF